MGDADDKGAVGLELVGKSIALATAMLPVVGFIVRYVAFIFVRGSASTLAAAASVSTLVVTGFGALLVPSFFFGILWVTYRFVQRLFKDDEAVFARAQSLHDSLDNVDLNDPERVREAIDELESILDQHNALQEKHRRHDKWFRASIVPAIILGALSLLFFNLATASIFAVFLVGQYFIARIVAKRVKPRFADFWFVVAGMLFTAALLAGFFGSLPAPLQGRYTFDANVLPSGEYQEIGQQDGRLFLEPCKPRPRATYSVASQDVRLFTASRLKSSFPPTLLSLFTGHRSNWHPGFQRC